MLHSPFWLQSVRHYARTRRRNRWLAAIATLVWLAAAAFIWFTRP